MSAIDTGLLARHPWVGRRKLTVDEYHRMVEVGILGERDRVELIEGELVAMVPIGTDHSGTVNALNYLLMRAVGDLALVSPQNPLRLGEFSEPQPDIVLLKPRADFYRKKVATPADVLLVVEVAQSSVAYDRGVKMPLYARHGIAEFWIVRLDLGTIEVYRGPEGEAFGSVRTVRPDETIELASMPGIIVNAGAVLGV